MVQGSAKVSQLQQKREGWKGIHGYWFVEQKRSLGMCKGYVYILYVHTYTYIYICIHIYVYICTVYKHIYNQFIEKDWIVLVSNKLFNQFLNKKITYRYKSLIPAAATFLHKQWWYRGLERTMSGPDQLQDEVRRGQDGWDLLFFSGIPGWVLVHVWMWI